MRPAAVVLPTVDEVARTIEASFCAYREDYKDFTPDPTSMAAARAVLDLIANVRGRAERDDLDDDRCYAPRTPRPQPAAITLPSRAALAGWLLGPLATFKRSGTPGGEFRIADEVIRFLRKYGHLPAEPEDPRVELLAEALHAQGSCGEPWPSCPLSTRENYLNDARDLLARLDAIGGAE